MKNRPVEVLLIRDESETHLASQLRSPNRHVVDVLNERDAINEIILRNPEWVILSPRCDHEAVDKMIESVRPWFSGRTLCMHNGLKVSDSADVASDTPLTETS